jgi:soluble lytic murein transglycosylase-like protein
MDRTTRLIIRAGFAMVAVLLGIAVWIVAAHVPRSRTRAAAAMASTVTPLLLPPGDDAPPAIRAWQPQLSRDIAYGSVIERAAVRHDLPPLLVAAVTRVESDFNPYEISHKGARGLMQVMPETGRRFGVAPDHLFDPERNVAAGTAYLSWLLDRYDGNLDLALAGYNAGEGAVDKYRGIPPYRETQQYVRKVRSAFYELQRNAAPDG